MHKLSRHIATRITIILTIVAILIGAGALFNNTKRIQRVFNDQLISASEMHTEILESDFNEISQLFRLSRRNAEVTYNDSQDKLDAQELAKSVLKQSWLINNVFYLSDVENDLNEGFMIRKLGDGEVVVTTIDQLELLVDSCHSMKADRDNVLFTGQWINICNEEFSKRAYIEPIVIKEEVVGYIGTLIDLEAIKLPDYRFLSTSSSTMLLDADGHILTSTEKVKHQSVKEFLIPNKALQTQDDIDNLSDLYGIDFLRAHVNGENRVIGLTQFDNDLILAVMVSERAISGQITQSIFIYALATISYFIVVLFVAFWLMDREMKPFAVLIEHLKRIKNGNFGDALPEEYASIKHEVGDIARAFESMRLNLQSVFTHLEDEKNKHLVTQRELSVMTEVLENSNEGVLILDDLRRIIYSNDAYNKISGYSSSELEGEHISMFDLEGKDYRDEILELLDEHGIWTGEVNQLKKANHSYPASLIIRLLRDDKNHPQYYFVITEDLTDKAMRESDWNAMFNKDSKTGLPNATQMRMDIDDLIDIGTRFALVYIGIDDFKSINEIYGFNAGDAVIVSLSEKLPLIAHENDMLYRIGGDEFAFVIDLDEHTEGIDKFIQQIQNIIRHPIRRNNISIYMTSSMGISSYPRDSSTSEGVITAALSALNKAKSDARGFHYYFSKELREQSERRQMILSQLYEAVERNEFNLMYQPKIDARNDKLIGMEALLRWDNKVLGSVSPSEFVPVAEDSAIIEKIGRWVIKQSILDLRRIHDLGYDELSLSVNFSGQQFRDESLFAWILENLAELELPPNKFELEITESLLLENLHEAVPQLNMLKRAGVVISVDDFGTGYSSLSYLQHLPIDVLKIDRSFLRGVEIDSPGTIINAIIELGKALNLQVVAEGIETEAQKQFLLSRGCVIHQGYLYDKPLEIGTFITRYSMRDD